MAVQFLVSDIISDIAFRMNMPAFASGDFVSDAQALQLLKNSARRLGGLFTGRFGDAYWLQTATLATQAGLELVSLPDNLATIQALYWIDSHNEARKLMHAELRDWQPTAQAWANSGDWLWPSVLPTYRLQGNAIALQPVPSAVYSLRLEYSTGIFVASSSDTIFGQVGWDEWLTLDCCERIADREDKQSDKWYAKKMAIQDEILEQASRRDRFVPLQVVDERGALDDPRVSGRRQWWYR